MKKYLSLLLALVILVMPLCLGGVTALAIEDYYYLPFDFEGKTQFQYLNEVSETWAVSESDAYLTLAYGSEALNGYYSLQIGSLPSGVRRVMTNAVGLVGISGFSKTDFETVSGIMLRMKVVGDSNEAHPLRLALWQTGIKEYTFLGKGACLYTKDGTVIDIASDNHNAYVPAGFDGYIFFPFATARSNAVSTPGSYDRYDTFPDSMVDLAKDFNIELWLGGTDIKANTWGGASVYIDDMDIYSGNSESDHKAEIITKNFNGYVGNYSFPLDFENEKIPFYTIDDVYDAAEHWKEGGITLLVGNEALSGNTSLQVGPMREGNSRTELTYAKMAGINGFDKYNLNVDKFGGVMLRIKLETPNPQEGQVYEFRIALHQTGVAKRTWLGRGTKAYNLDGSAVEVPNSNISVRLPADFDGFLFMPFEWAQSETVTVTGSYDRYETYPNSMVDLAKDYRMSVVFYNQEYSGGGFSNWDNAVVSFDDMYIYTGAAQLEHHEFLRSLGYEINTCAHINDEGKITKAPTCTEKGESAHTCLICGESIIKTVPALGHNYPEEWTLAKEATYNENGEEYRVCPLCSEKETRTILALYHYDFEYKITNGAATVTGYNGNDTEVVIPSVFEGYPVVSIARSAFEANTKITNVIIPQGVTSVGKFAFYYCTNLTSVTLPSDTLLIDNYAFDGCKNLKYTFFAASQEKYNGVAVGENNGYLTNSEIYFINGTVVGDFNGDGIISSTDIVVFKKLLLRNANNNSAFAAKGDVNTDGVLDVRDLICIKLNLANS